MDRTRGGKNQPKCFLSHVVLNKLSVMIGSCDIALEEMKAGKSAEAQIERRVTVVREMAWDIVKEVREYGCELDQAGRAALLSALRQESRSGQAGTGRIVAVDQKGDPLQSHS